MSLQLVSSLVDSYQHVTGGDVSVCGVCVGVSAVDDDHMSLCVCVCIYIQCYTDCITLSYEALLRTLTCTNLQIMGEVVQAYWSEQNSFV